MSKAVDVDWEVLTLTLNLPKHYDIPLIFMHIICEFVDCSVITEIR